MAVMPEKPVLPGWRSKWRVCSGYRVCCHGPLPGGGGPGTSLSGQPQFGLIEEGVNLLLVIAGPQPGGRELLIPNLIRRQGRFPHSEKRIPDSVEEGVNLLLVIAGPQPGGREFRRLDPPSEYGAVDFRAGRRFRGLLSCAGRNGGRPSPACRVAARRIGGAVPGTARLGQRVRSWRLAGLHPESPLVYQVALDPAAETAPSRCGRLPGGGSPAHDTGGRCLSSLHPALQASHLHHPARSAIVLAASPTPEVMAHYDGCALIRE